MHENKSTLGVWQTYKHGENNGEFYEEKTLYGMKQAPWAWHAHIDNYLVKPRISSDSKL